MAESKTENLEYSLPGSQTGENVGSGASENLVYIALGSNVGDRFENLKYAVRMLALHPLIQLTAFSPVYETEPHVLTPGEKQNPYFNAVIEVKTSLTPLELLDALQEVEQSAGREPAHMKWAPRTLDLDLLIYGDIVADTERLELPHPRLGDRLFVLRPLADIAPDLFVPLPFGASVTDLLSRCSDEHVVVRTSYTLDGEQES